MLSRKIYRNVSTKILASMESNLAFDISQTGYKKRMELKPRRLSSLRDIYIIDEMKKSLETVYDYLDPTSIDS